MLTTAPAGSCPNGRRTVMKRPSFEGFESPYLDNELEPDLPARESGHDLERAVDESPFAASVDLRSAEAVSLSESTSEPLELETIADEANVADEQVIDSDELEQEDISTLFEQVMREPKPATTREEIAQPPNFQVLDASGKPLTEGEYVFRQGDLIERGEFDAKAAGRARLGKIDPTQPFLFEVRDR